MTRLQAFSHDTFRSLRTRNFRLFFVGQLISQTGTWLSMVTQTLLVLHLTASGVALGLLTAFQFGPMLVLGAWAGAVADRADKRRLLMTVQSLSMVQSLVLGAVVLVFTGGEAGLSPGGDTAAAFSTDPHMGCPGGVRPRRMSASSSVVHQGS